MKETEVTQQCLGHFELKALYIKEVENNKNSSSPKLKPSFKKN